MLYRLNAKRVPVEIIRAKAEEYISEGHLSRQDADSLLRHIEAERRVCRVTNSTADTSHAAAGAASSSAEGHAPLSRAQLEEMLAAMEENMQSGDGEQWRLYSYIVELKT